MKNSQVTIGFVPRERFEIGARCLQRIFDCTRIDFKLIVVKTKMPEKYERELLAVLEGRDNVEIISFDTYKQPNESKNAVIKQTKTPYLLMIENDCEVTLGWLGQLLQTMTLHQADVTLPLLYERRWGKKRIHHDNRMGKIETINEDRVEKHRFVKDKSIMKAFSWEQPKQLYAMEHHCNLYRMSIFDKIGLFDERLSSREGVDLSLALNKARAKTMYDPRVKVEFVAPPPVAEDDREFFFWVWDYEQAAASNDLINEKWHLINMPWSKGFVRAYRTRITKNGFLWAKLKQQFPRLIRNIKRKLGNMA